MDSVNPATGEPLAEVAVAGRADIDRAVTAARAAFEGAWGKTPPRERAKYLFRIARLVQEKSRELAVLESMDGGKPIRESRDIDLPLVAAHFFYYAGWADKLDYAFPGRTSEAPVGSLRGQVIPWNFPLLMAAWKIAPALACGNTVVIKPAETTTSVSILHLAEIFRRRRACGRWRGQHRHRRRRDRRRAGRAPRHRQDRVHRIDRGRQVASPPPSPVPAARSSPSSSEARRRISSLRTPPIDQAVEGVINGHLLQPGACLLCRQPAARPGDHRRHACDRQAGRDRSRLFCGSAIRSTKTPTSARSTPKAQLGRIHELVDSGVEEGADFQFQPACDTRCRKAGYWFRPSFFTGVTAKATASPARRSSDRCSA